MRINRYMNYKTIQKQHTELNWDGDIESEIEFDQYVTRMWLDNCDENKSVGSTTYTHNEYKTKFHDWLWKNYNKQDPENGRWNWYGELNGSND